MIISTAVSVQNQQFVLLIGGYHALEFTNSIWIYSLKAETFKESKIKCPGDRGGKAFVINYPKNDELSVFGYIREQWNISGIDDCLYPPRYLIKIINRYYLNEWIHFINKDGAHWKIDVLHIIDNA